MPRVGRQRSDLRRYCGKARDQLAHSPVSFRQHSSQIGRRKPPGSDRRLPSNLAPFARCASRSHARTQETSAAMPSLLFLARSNLCSNPATVPLFLSASSFQLSMQVIFFPFVESVTRIWDSKASCSRFRDDETGRRTEGLRLHDFASLGGPLRSNGLCRGGPAVTFDWDSSIL